MSRYNVHAYAVVCVSIPIEAKTAIMAAKNMADTYNFYEIGDYAEDIEGFLVDSLGEKDPLKRSVFLEADMTQPDISLAPTFLGRGKQIVYLVNALRDIHAAIADSVDQRIEAAEADRGLVAAKERAETILNNYGINTEIENE